MVLRRSDTITPAASNEWCGRHRSVEYWLEAQKKRNTWRIYFQDVQVHEITRKSGHARTEAEPSQQCIVWVLSKINRYCEKHGITGDLPYMMHREALK